MLKAEALQSFWPTKAKGVPEVSEREVESLSSGSTSSSHSGSPTRSPTLSSLTMRSSMHELPKVSIYPTTHGDAHGPATNILVLKDVVTMLSVHCRKELGPTLAEEMFSETPTLHSFLDFIATDRLRKMPHKGSKWDKILKWAESLARKIDMYERSVHALFTYSSEAARLFWGASKLLLQLGRKNSVVLEKVFGVLYQMGQTIDFFLRNKTLFSASHATQQVLAAAYADLIRLTVEVSIYCKKNSERFTATSEFSDFDTRFGRTVDSFYHHKNRFSNEAWTISLKNFNFGGSHVTINAIRQWLSPQDRTLQLYLSDRMGTRTSRYEFTCEWFEASLRDFQRGKEDTMVVLGGPGSGKSVLAGWILENLRKTRRSHHESLYDVISVTIDGNVRTQRSSLKVVQDLLLQLIERNVGNVALYKILSGVYQRTQVDGLEEALWTAYETALHELQKHSKNRKLMIVVDGIDQLKGGDVAIGKLYKRLQESAKKHELVKCIVLSRPSGKLPQPRSHEKDVRCISIDSDAHNAEDIRSFVEHAVMSSKELVNLKSEDRKAIVERLSKSAHGSFLWVDLSLTLLRQENTLAGIMKCLDHSSSRTLPELIHHVCHHVDVKKSSDARLIFSALLVAERPLTVNELKNLLEMDTATASHSSRLSDIEEDIYKACGSLVVIRDGIVRFSHLSIKDHLVTITEKHGLTIKDAHGELATRCSAYLKVCLKEDPEPVFEPCGWGKTGVKSSLEELVEKNHLLEYAARYWTTHFYKSKMYDATGKTRFVLTEEFRRCFPESSLVALIEGTWWETQTSASFATHMHSLALELRKNVFGSRVNKCLVQCQLNLALTLKKTSSVTVTDCYFEVWQTSRTVLGEHSALAVSCAEAYLHSTETITTKSTTTVTTRTTTTTRTEEITKYMWTAHKHIHGESHELTISYGQRLASLYLRLEKTELALSITRELHHVCVKTYGYSHSETIKISQQLTTVLQKVSRYEECVQIQRTTLDVITKTTEVWEEKRITTSVSMIETYEKTEMIHEAESLFVSMQKQITEACEHHHEEHVYKAKIDITLKYVRFLCRHKRENEAQASLASLWTYFKSLLETKDSHTDFLLVQIRTIGVEMKELKMVTVAESVFSSLWSFYKRTNRHTSVEAAATVIELTKVISKTETKKTESILTEVFQASLTKTSTSTSTTTTTTVETTTVKTCVELSSFYEREERWSEVVDVCTTVLVKLWPTLINHRRSEGTVCYLPSSHHEEAIDIALKLAISHKCEGRIEEAESIYINLFEACKSSLQLSHHSVLRTAMTLVKFYESTSMVEKAMHIYEKLHKECHEVLGGSHSVSIKITYELAHFCERHQPRKAEVYYTEIIEYRRSQGCEECDSETIEASLALCRIYEHDKRLKEARNIYHSIWLAFIHGAEIGMSAETIIEVHRKYVSVLEALKVEFTEIRTITIQFKETCVKHFGDHHKITIQANVHLAEILERHEYHEEAAAVYEEIVNVTSTTTTTTTSTSKTTSTSSTSITTKVISEVRQRLARLYSSKSSTKAKAEVIYYQSWSEVHQRHGYAHKESLARLKELIIFFKKQNTKECIHTATETLHTTIIEIFKSERDTQKLFNSAQTIAALYLELGLQELAFEFTQELRQIITTTTTVNKTKFKYVSSLEGHAIDRRCLVFVMTFEEGLRGHCSHHLYTDIMNDIVTETTMFESWTRAIHYGGRFESTLTTGAHLIFFLTSKGRGSECDHIEEKLWSLFLEEAGESSKDKSGHVWELFKTCMHEMGKEGSNVTILEAGLTAVSSCYKSGDFHGAYALANWLYSYVKRHGGFVEQHNLTIGFKLALYMAGRSGSATWKRCHDQTLNEKMGKLSNEILKEVLKSSEHEHISFSKMPLEDVNVLVGILGHQGPQKNFHNLERILRELWEARQNRNSWELEMIVAIGCRLCEVLFVHGHKDEAVHLCEDICYNLKRVGGKLNPTTLYCFNLLTSFHNSRQHYGKAMSVHDAILQQIVSDEHLDNATANIAIEQLRQLKNAYQRNNHKWNEKGHQHYEELFGEIHHVFKHCDQGSKWKEAKIDNITEWAHKHTSDATSGKWHEPKLWEFMEIAKVLKSNRHSHYDNDYDGDL